MSKISELFPRGSGGSVGGVEYWAGDIVETELTTLPDGRTLLPCDGSLVPEGTYPDLEPHLNPALTLPDYTQHSNSYKVVAENGSGTTSPLRAGDQILTLRNDVGPSGQALLLCNGSMILKTEYPDLVGVLAEDLIITAGEQLANSCTNSSRQGDTRFDLYGGRYYNPVTWDTLWKETQYLNVFSDFNRWAGSRSALYPDHVIPTFYRNWKLGVHLNNGNWSGDDATMEAQFEDKDGVRIFGFRADRHSNYQTRMRYGLEGETNTTRSAARTSATNSHVNGYFSFDVDNQIEWIQVDTGAHSFTETGVRVQDIAQIRIIEVHTESNWTSGGNTSSGSADAFIDIRATDGTAVVTDKLYLPTSANPNSSGFIALPYKVVAEN